MFPFITNERGRESATKKSDVITVLIHFQLINAMRRQKNSDGWILFDVSPNSLSLYNKACDVAAVRIYCLILIVERLFVSKVFQRPLFSWYLSVPLLGGTSFSRRGAFYFSMSLHGFFFTNWLSSLKKYSHHHRSFTHVFIWDTSPPPPSLLLHPKKH